MGIVKKVTKLSFEFNEAQGRSNAIATSIEHELSEGTNPDFYEDGDVNTRYEVTVTVKELGDWDKT